MKATRYTSLDDLFLRLVPSYRSRSWLNWFVTFPWDDSVADHVAQINPKRYQKRIREYLIPGEYARSKGALRFGVLKSGRGLQGQRSDFCLVGGHFEKGHVTLFYRRVEIVGGLHFDLALIRELEKQRGPIRRVTIFASRAFMFGVRGRASLSKEKLHRSLLRFYRSRQ